MPACAPKHRPGRSCPARARKLPAQRVWLCVRVPAAPSGCAPASSAKLGFAAPERPAAKGQALTNSSATGQPQAPLPTLRAETLLIAAAAPLMSEAATQSAQLAWSVCAFKVGKPLQPCACRQARRPERGGAAPRTTGEEGGKEKVLCALTHPRSPRLALAAAARGPDTHWERRPAVQPGPSLRRRLPPPHTGPGAA